MDSSGSFISTVITRLRAALDEPDIDSKYNEDVLVRHAIQPAIGQVWSRINHTSNARILIPADITLVDGTSRYKLPPNCKMVERFSVIDSNQEIVGTAKSHDFLRWNGYNYRIEGTIGALYLVTGQDTFNLTSARIWYEPTGDFLLCKGTATPAAASTDTIQISTITAGQFDTRDNAYAGAVYRHLPATNFEKNVDAQISSATLGTSPTLPSLTLSGTESFTNTDANPFEIAPAGSWLLWQAIAYRAAMTVGGWRNVSEKKLRQLALEYKDARKSIMDAMTFVNPSKGHAFRRDTIHHEMLGTDGLQTVWTETS